MGTILTKEDFLSEFDIGEHHVFKLRKSQSLVCNVCNKAFLDRAIFSYLVEPEFIYVEPYYYVIHQTNCTDIFNSCPTSYLIEP